MASSPAFAVTPRISWGSVSGANPNTDGTGVLVQVIAGVSSGTRVNEIVVQATGDPADCVVHLFIKVSTSYVLFDSFDLNNPEAGSTTVAPYRTRRLYDNLVLPSGSYSLVAGVTVAPTAGVINVIALGADL